VAGSWIDQQPTFVVVLVDAREERKMRPVAEPNARPVCKANRIALAEFTLSTALVAD